MVVRLPYTSLGVDAPKAGDCWMVNFGRDRHAGKSLECSIWSPNEFGTGLVELAAFGELYLIMAVSISVPVSQPCGFLAD